MLISQKVRVDDDRNRLHPTAPDLERIVFSDGFVNGERARRLESQTHLLSARRGSSSGGAKIQRHRPVDGISPTENDPFGRHVGRRHRFHGIDGWRTSILIGIGMIRISRLFRSNRSDRAPIRILLHPNTNPPSNITFANMGGRKKDTHKWNLFHPSSLGKPGNCKSVADSKRKHSKESGSPNCCLTDSSNP